MPPFLAAFFSRAAVSPLDRRADSFSQVDRIQEVPMCKRNGPLTQGGAAFQAAMPAFLRAFFVSGVLLRHGRLAGINRRKPPVAVRLRAVDDSEELLLQLLRDRAAPSLAD